MPARWKSEKEAELIRWLKTEQFTNAEIALKMGLNVNQITTKANSLGYINPVYRKRITKHAHLREKVMTYFLTHTSEETRVRFGLTQSEIKSLFTVGYRDPRFSHLRKDSRRKDAWTLEETLFLLRHAGIRERGWIAKKINRSTARNIKERMQKWGAATKHLNGMPLSWARQFWPNDLLESRIHTKAGPSGGTGIWRFQIIPWHECLRLSRKYPTAVEICAGIRAMVRFQEFIYGTKSSVSIRRHINAAVEAR
jgi:hypothetical protein